ncbi:probable galacturonosyltransferase 7 isoform X2 [Olea europaea subsp. europaea]|uniref:Hexosyltransferase n=1 Tax=Olea europaea subsp. europaea TaxID=158383 RepID=A0A8S0UWE2_OLEEU|nr:probable galacturonosyltransferase 7 isoform X2 [Olea europaea subsp. europaea]
MEAAIAKAKSCPVDCNNVDKKLRQLVDLTEDEANFHRKQSAFLYQLAVQTMPKSLHCLSMRLTVEYFRSPLDLEQSLSEKVLNPDLHHYVIFSRNLLASSVAINSTVQNTEVWIVYLLPSSSFFLKEKSFGSTGINIKCIDEISFIFQESEKQVFHVLTDRENYFAMKLWFFINKYREATVQVLNIEDLKLNNHYKLAPLHLSLPEEFRVSFLRVDKLSSYQIRTEYLSIFSHSHYLLPKIFPTLKKIVVLDDDILTQRDLSELWSVDMGGKVIGAVQFCAVKLGQLKNYLPRYSVSENSCAWMSGVNIIDLSRWREHNLTETFQRLVQEMSTEEGLSETTALSASMLTFQGQVYALDDSWMLSGLGLNYGHEDDALRTAAVLHFNGNMKPWLELGIPKYKSSWRKFLNLQNQFLSDCNVNP